MKRIEKIFIYVFLLLNSISGLQIAGKTVNSILVGVFSIYIFAKSGFLSKGIIVRKKDSFVLYLVASVISCICSLLYDYTLPHESIVIGYMINSFIYLFDYVALCQIKNEIGIELIDTFKNGLIYTARIQAVWGIMQLVLLYSMHININEIVFVDILKSSNTRDWIMGFYTGNVWNMRITGLNFENSMFAMVVCIGAALDKKIIWKYFMFAIAVLSLSRTAWFMILGYIVITIIRYLMLKNKGSKDRFFKNTVRIILTVTTAVLAYTKSRVVRRQVSNIVYRLTDNSAVSVSGARHFLYYPYGVDIWLTRSNILQMLFGYGMRCSGVAFSQQPDIVNIIGIHEKFTSAWAVECDVIGLLLGGGIVTFVLYYISIFKSLKSKFGNAVWMILIGGITYHYHSISYVMFVLMFAMASLHNKTVEE